MRKFSSYGPIDKTLHYHAPRQELIDLAYQQLLAGHYITVWAPRQTGKSWVMLEVARRLHAENQFEVAIITIQSAKSETAAAGVLQVLITQLSMWFGREFPIIQKWSELVTLFSSAHFSKPLILILDEFDALSEEAINMFANEFRTMYMMQRNRLTRENGHLLHGLALIGVRSVLGIENVSGSLFNVQRGLHIPNLTEAEVMGMLAWYEQESGQLFEAGVKERVYYEFRGQPGLTCWFGELLTETFNQHHATITRRDFDIAYSAATDALPNNNILNIISKAKQEPYRQWVLELFKTGEKQRFHYDNPQLNFLYMNGVIDQDVVSETERYLKFPSPFVQKRLFNYFANELFHGLGRLFDPFESLADVFTPQGLDIKALLRRYQLYLQQNRAWLLKDAPRRKTDLRIYEAVYHFNLYMYLQQFFQCKGQVYPEFPTGNGKIDLIIRHNGRVYGLELKSFADESGYREALQQAAMYGQQLSLTEITLGIFVERVDEANRLKYEAVYHDVTRGVTVTPVLMETEL